MNRSKAKTRIRCDEVEGMGVVSLIVFIAIIIVITATAFVHIFPASTVQKQVEHTGEIGIMGDPTGFKVIDIIGDRNNPNDAAELTNKIVILEIKVGVRASSPVINLSETIIEITDGTRDVTLTFVDTSAGEYYASASATQFAAQLLRDMAPVNTLTNYTIMTPGDIIKLFIDFNACKLNKNTGTICAINIIPKYCYPTQVTFSTPSVYNDRYVELYNGIGKYP